MNNTILIYDQIGGDKIDGSKIAEQIHALSKDHSVINIRINSLGGSVINGMSIVSAIMDVPSTVIVYVDGVAASMASVVAVSCDKVVMKDYAVMMIHNPHYNKEKLTAKEKTTVQIFANSLATIYKNRSGLDEKTLLDLMAKETWFSASECLENKFITDIESTGRELEKDPEKIAAVATEELLASYVLPQEKAHTEENSNTSQKETMNTEILEALGLEATAEAADVVAAYTAKVAELQAVVTERDALKAEVETLTATVAENKAKQVEELVNRAVTEGRIKATEKEDWSEIALLNYDKAVKLINAIEPIKQLSALTKSEEDNTPADPYADLNPMERLMAIVEDKNKAL